MAVVSRRKQGRAWAECLTTDDIGAMVYIRDAAVGEMYKVEAVDPDDLSKMPAVAMIIQKITSTSCVIQFYGEVADVYTGLTPGSRYFVGDATGALSEGAPTGSGKIIQSVGVALSSNVLIMDPHFVMAKRN